MEMETDWIELNEWKWMNSLQTKETKNQTRSWRSSSFETGGRAVIGWWCYGSAGCGGVVTANELNIPRQQPMGVGVQQAIHGPAALNLAARVERGAGMASWRVYYYIQSSSTEYSSSCSWVWVRWMSMGYYSMPMVVGVWIWSQWQWNSGIVHHDDGYSPIFISMCNK